MISHTHDGQEREGEFLVFIDVIFCTILKLNLQELCRLYFVLKAMKKQISTVLINKCEISVYHY